MRRRRKGRKEETDERKMWRRKKRDEKEKIRKEGKVKKRDREEGRKGQRRRGREIG